MAKITITLLMATFSLVILIITGALIYQKLEGWSFVDSLYFTTTTITTVGYGDFTPTTEESKIFTIFYSISGIAIALYVMVTIGTYFMEHVYSLRERINALARYMPKKGRRK